MKRNIILIFVILLAGSRSFIEGREHKGTGNYYRISFNVELGRYSSSLTVDTINNMLVIQTDSIDILNHEVFDKNKYYLRKYCVVKDSFNLCFDSTFFTEQSIEFIPDSKPKPNFEKLDYKFQETFKDTLITQLAS